jgi:hypothetical protein
MYIYIHMIYTYIYMYSVDFLPRTHMYVFIHICINMNLHICVYTYIGVEFLLTSFHGRNEKGEAAITGKSKNHHIFIFHDLFMAYLWYIYIYTYIYIFIYMYMYIIPSTAAMRRGGAAITGTIVQTLHFLSCLFKHCVKKIIEHIL